MIDSIAATSALARLSPVDATDSTNASNMAQMSAATNAQPSSSFSQAVESFGSNVISNLKTAEANSFGAIRGEVATRDVVDSIMQAQQSLQTAIAIRDKVVTAFLEVGRMQI